MGELGEDLVVVLANAFHDWVNLVLTSRRLIAEDAAHAALPKEAAPA